MKSTHLRRMNQQLLAYLLEETTDPEDQTDFMHWLQRCAFEIMADACFSSFKGLHTQQGNAVTSNIFS